MVTETQSVNATAVSPADGSMWIATTARGLVRVGKNGKAFAYSAEKGDFSCNTIVSLCFDNEGVLWMKDAEGAVYSYTSFSGFVKQAVVPESVATVLSAQETIEEVAVEPQVESASRPWFGSWWFLLLTILLLAYFIYSIFGRKPTKKTIPSAPSAPVPNVAKPVEPVPTFKPAPAPEPAPVIKPAAPKAPKSEQPRSVITAPVEGSFYEKVYNLVKENYTNADFGVESVADALAMSRVHLNRKLKAENRPSPSDLIKSMRMELAAEMLREGSLSIGEIAVKSGFSSASYFSSAFKEYYGVSPAAYGK